MSKTTPTFYVFHGPDEFTRAETLDNFKRRLGSPDTVSLNTTILDGKSLTVAELHHACDAVPFLSEKRLVIVENWLARLTSQKGQKKSLDALADYLPHLPATTRLVFVERKSLPVSHPIVRLAKRDERGYVKQFDALDAKALPGWIKKRARKYGGEIEPQAAHQLAAVVESDLRLLDQEIAKLATYTNAERPITKDDVNRMVPYAQAAIIFDMVDALGQRNGPTASQTLHSLLEAGEHPLGLLGMIVRQFRLLIQVKELKANTATPRSVSKSLGLHPFPARKLYNQATHFTAEQLETVYRHLLDTDVAIKSGKIEAEVALDLLVAGIAASE